MTKRFLSILISLTLTAAILFTAALFLIPASVESAWRDLGLPEKPLAQWETLAGRTSVTPQETRLYGSLEARSVHVMSELDGRAVKVLAAEGDSVEAGQPLIRLDPTDVQAQIAAAEQAVAAAKAARDAAAAPPNETVKALADEAVSAARTDVENARRTLEQARAIRENPQAIQTQIDQTAALIPVARAQVEAAQASVDQSQTLIEEARTDGSMQGKYRVRILEEQKAAAEAELKAAHARLNGLYRTLALLKKMRDDPLALEANVHQAEGQVALAQAALKVAEADREARIAPPQPESVAVADAGVRKARAALDLARWQTERLVITAPISGQVQAKLLETGEVVQPGLPLLTLADTSEMELWAYVSGQDLHRVHLNRRLPVEVIAIPGKRFEGQVFFIASEAQFRPSNILNPDDRGDMVFRIKLRLPNNDGQLKPGMPADVILP